MSPHKDEIGRLYLEHFDMLWAWALRRCNKKKEDADELLQQTMLALIAGTYPWKHGVEFRPQAYWVMRRLKSRINYKPATENEVLYGDFGTIEERPGGPDPEQALALKRADDVYQAIMANLPRESFARALWRVMYDDDVQDIDEQVEILGPPKTRIYTARKLIKRVCAIVFARFGFVFPRSEEQS